jgi:hypothetical protein
MCHNIESIVLLIRCAAALRGFPLTRGQLSLMPHQPHGHNVRAAETVARIDGAAMRAAALTRAVILYAR